VPRREVASSVPSPPRLDGALCIGNADLFFPDQADVNSARRAKLLCLVCPARKPCYRYTVKVWPRYGIWAGMTERDRHALRRKNGLGK
jgi:WhiB family transcriptional regulator, redox-sensing transcriptional regulator